MTNARLHFGALVLGVLLLSGCAPAANPTFEDAERSPRSQQPHAPAFRNPILSMPRHGARTGTSSMSELVTCLQARGGNPDAGTYGTLKVSAPPGRDTYVVQLRSRRGSQNSVSLVVRPGRSAEVRVPTCGTRIGYAVFYAAGTKWYGYPLLFGPRGAYSKAGKKFPFEEGVVWSLSLSLRVGGNLSGSGVDYEQFLR